MTDRTCCIDQCGKPTHGHGWCETHYRRWTRHGDPLWTRPSADERFWAKVDKSGDCWVWTAGLFTDGYGQFKVNGQSMGAHRYAERLVRAVPDGLHLDHLCRNRACVNPDHLEPVTCGENIRRGETGLARGAQQRAKTHCAKGHAYDETNTIWVNGFRQCRECKRDYWNRRGRALRAERRKAKD